MKLLAELQRRNVIRMAGLYLVGAWLVTQVAATLLPVFEAPGWVMKALVGLLAVGFFAALVFSWVFELTPAGLKRDDDVSAGDSIAPQTARRMDRVIIVVTALALGYFAVDKFVLAPGRVADAPLVALSTDHTDLPAVANTSPPATTPPVAAPVAVNAKSIAVLAFANMSADKDNEYFSDGVAEEILNALAKVEDLRVAGRTSSFYFKGRSENLATIGGTLGVAHVLEGSVRKQGERLRISAKLLRVSDGVEMWAESFDGTDADIFALQESIARKVTTELKVALNAGEQGRLVDAGTNNPDAYALYLRATDVFNRRDSGEFLNAIKLLQESVALDPNFARAYSKLGALHALTPEYLGTDITAGVTAAQASARRALALQPQLAEPHAVIAVTREQNNRYSAARAEFEQALAIEPDDLLSNLWYAIHLGLTGYESAKMTRLERVLALDPLLPNALNHLGRGLEWRGDLESARRALERAKELGAANTDVFQAFVSLGQGRMAQARAELERTVDTLGAGLPSGTSATIAAGILEDREPRVRALAHVRKLVSEPATANSGILAWALILLGAPDDALAMIAARPLNSDAWHTALWSPRGLGARTSPAFPEFARKVGFAEVWDQYGAPDLCKKNEQGDYVCE